MNVHIGFADAVREAVAHGHDDWCSAGWTVVRRTEPFSQRGDRSHAMRMASDPMTSDTREYYRLAAIMKVAEHESMLEASARAKQLRLAEFIGRPA